MFVGYDRGFGFNSKPLGGQSGYDLHLKGITGCYVKSRCWGTMTKVQKPRKRLLLQDLEKWWMLGLKLVVKTARNDHIEINPSKKEVNNQSRTALNQEISHSRPEQQPGEPLVG